MNYLVRNGLVWLCGAAILFILRLSTAGQSIADGFQILAILFAIVALVQIARGLLLPD